METLGDKSRLWMSVEKGRPRIRKRISNVTAIRGDFSGEIGVRAFNVGAPASCQVGFITEGQRLARHACGQLHPDLSYLSFHKLCFVPALEM